MALQEFDSFICKFKNLLKAGRSTSLRMTSSAGKAEVHLSVELDDAPLVTLLHPRSRNGPARKRRREKRAAVCEAVEKEVAGKAATVKVPAKESDMEKIIAEQAAVGKSESDATVHVVEGARIDNGCEDIVHEFCPDEDFNVETGDHVVENSEVFKMSFSDK